MPDLKPKILLTGGTGLVGNAILHALIAENYSTLALVRNTSALSEFCHRPCVTITESHLDNISDASLQDIRLFKPDVVIHTAWIGTEHTDRNSAAHVLPNIQSSLKLLETATAAGCAKWISFGSQAEYSPAIDANITEDMPTYPDNSYGITKLATCHMLKDVCETSGVQFAWLRLFASYGKNLKPSYVIPYLIECFTTNTMPILKAPHTEWDYLHVNDVASAVMALVKQHYPSDIYNLAYGKGYTIGEIALMLAELLAFKQRDALRELLATNNAASTRRVADITKLTTAIHWQPKIDIREGLKLCL